MTGQASAIESVFQQFKLDAKVTAEVTGPSVVRYEVEVGDGVKMEKVASLAKNIAYGTAAVSVRVQAPIPGRAVIGIELPRANREIVRLADVTPADNHPLTVAFGKDIDGNSVSFNLADMPHLLVAGTTGSGKSSFVNTMLVSLLSSSPEDVQLTLIDPKQVELTPYDGVAHLRRPVITEVAEAVDALKSLVAEMESRYMVMRAAKVRHIDDLGGHSYIVVVVDELADLIMQARDEVEPLIVRLLQKGRAAGIHLVLATQRPSVDVVTGLIKTNAPSRLSFATASLVDSRVILDEPGAEQLLGNGDALFRPVGSRTATRIQGAYVSDKEIQAAVRRATAVGAVEDMVNQLSGTPDEGPTVLDLLNDLITKSETMRKDNAKYLEELLKPKKWWGGNGGKLDQLSQAPEKLGTSTDVLVQVEEMLTMIRDNALSGV